MPTKLFWCTSPFLPIEFQPSSNHPQKSLLCKLILPHLKFECQCECCVQHFVFTIGLCQPTLRTVYITKSRVSAFEDPKIRKQSRTITKCEYSYPVIKYETVPNDCTVPTVHLNVRNSKRYGETIFCPFISYLNGFVNSMFSSVILSFSTGLFRNLSVTPCFDVTMLCILEGSCCGTFIQSTLSKRNFPDLNTFDTNHTEI